MTAIPVDPTPALLTVAEASGYRRTSYHREVLDFLARLAARTPHLRLASMGTSGLGQDLAYVVVSRRGLLTPEAARASGLPIVLVVGNIHAGEVEGKEAALALVRDLAKGAHPEWMQSMVLLVNPVYNADGTDKVTLTSRGFQHGPIGGQGTRANAQGLNINRDNIKLETPEARSMVRMLNDFDPHVMLDLHTTNGSRHAYQLTYETPNNPAVDPAVVKETRALLAHVVQAVKAKDGWDFRSYGNVSGQTPERVWTTVEDLPRYTHNYWGLRNRFGILSETYSYLPFAERVTSNRRLLEEVLGYAHTNAARLRALATAADARSLVGQRLSMRSAVARLPGKIEILMGAVDEEVNPYSGRIIHKRRNVSTPERMWDETTFASTDSERVPAAYIVPASEKAVLERLRAHGIVLEPLGAAAAPPLEAFQIASTTVMPQAFENHQERTVTGTWAPTEPRDLAGAIRVPMTQRLARLAFYLLEPRSNDGLATWNVVDEAIKDSRYPVLRTRN